MEFINNTSLFNRYYADYSSKLICHKHWYQKSVFRLWDAVGMRYPQSLGVNFSTDEDFWALESSGRK